MSPPESVFKVKSGLQTRRLRHDDEVFRFAPGCALGSQERQDKLREMGFVDVLHKLTQSADPNLSDRWATEQKTSLPLPLAKTVV